MGYMITGKLEGRIELEFSYLKSRMILVHGNRKSFVSRMFVREAVLIIHNGI